MKLQMEYLMARSIYERSGSVEFLKFFQHCCAELELYTFGKDWLINDKYILKFKGTNGDLVITWD